MCVLFCFIILLCLDVCRPRHTRWLQTGPGWSHDPGAFRPRYLPLDEEHPPEALEHYGLSKVWEDERGGRQRKGLFQFCSFLGGEGGI